MEESSDRLIQDISEPVHNELPAPCLVAKATPVEEEKGLTRGMFFTSALLQMNETHNKGKESYEETIKINSGHGENFGARCCIVMKNTKNPASVGRRGGMGTTTRDMSSLLTDTRTGNVVYALQAAPFMQNSSSRDTLF